MTADYSRRVTSSTDLPRDASLSVGLSTAHTMSRAAVSVVPLREYSSSGTPESCRVYIYQAGQREGNRGSTLGPLVD